MTIFLRAKVLKDFFKFFWFLYIKFTLVLDIILYNLLNSTGLLRLYGVGIKLMYTYFLYSFYLYDLVSTIFQTLRCKIFGTIILCLI